MGVATPGVRIPLSVESHCVAPACTDATESDVCRSVGFSRLVSRDAVGVAAQAAGAVVSPGVEVAVRAHGYHMRFACARLGEGDACRGLHLVGPVGWFAAGDGTAQLASAVVSPGVEAAIGAQGHGKSIACAHMYEVDACRGLRSAGMAVLLVGGVAAQLPMAAVVSPGVEAAIGAHSRGMEVSSVDLADADAAFQRRGQCDGLAA